MLTATAPAIAPAPPTRLLSICEPWASLIVHGYRPVEHRSRSISFRGRLGIHACLSEAADIWEEWDDDGEEYPSWESMTGLSQKQLRGMCRPGHVIGSVEVWGTIEAIGMHDPDTDELLLPPGYEEWVDDGWVWLLRNARRYVQPIPARGKLSLWVPDAGLAAAIVEAERTAVDCPQILPKVRPWWFDDDL